MYKHVTVTLVRAFFANVKSLAILVNRVPILTSEQVGDDATFERLGSTLIDRLKEAHDHVDYGIYDVIMSTTSTEVDWGKTIDYLTEKNIPPASSDTAMYVKEVTVIDPDTQLPVDIAIYKDSGTDAMFGVDSAYISRLGDDEGVISPVSGKGVTLVEPEAVSS